MDVDRGVPEVFGSCYDVCVLLDSTSKMMDGKKLTDMKLPFAAELVAKKALKKVEGTVVETLPNTTFKVESIKSRKFLLFCCF